MPLCIHAADDPVGRRGAAAQMLALRLARQHELRTALGVHRTTLYRQRNRGKAHGILGGALLSLPALLTLGLLDPYPATDLRLVYEAPAVA